MKIQPDQPVATTGLIAAAGAGLVAGTKACRPPACMRIAVLIG